MHRFELALSATDLNLLLRVELSQLLLLLVKLFLGSCALFSDHEVSVAVIFHPALLNCVNLDVLAANVIFELRNLPLQVLDHLVSRLKHLLL